ncbi:aquaporin-like protein [Coniochaeta ligniaria NRRL 30616]|uniref:Aquaporin-like protein n=1 Tax=Coniochaeta ligniaria NRRL 30616 TaxID=1408157 RepID=A0A1J7IKT1_9PEZI|nr:aquaporin-like protein [Coniochaeta ligniaria NRRL 30616]
MDNIAMDNKQSNGTGAGTGGPRSLASEKRSIFPAHRKRQPLSTMQSHIFAAIAEFIGTFMFLFLAYAGHLMAVSQASVKVNGGMDNQTVLIVGLAYAISLLVNVWAFYRISGGLFNPAVSLGLALTGHIGWVRAALLVPMQLLASMVAAAMARALIPVSIRQANTTLSGGTSVAQGLFLEMFFTAELVFVVLMLAQEKSRDTFMAPIGIGLAMLTCMIPGIFFTGGSLNPARSFGPAVAGRFFPGYHWIYWLGPLMGACLAAGYYHLVKFFRYEEVNPGQDNTRAPTPEPFHDPNNTV